MVVRATFAARKGASMNRRRLFSAATLALATTLLLAPAARATEGERGGDRLQVSFLADPLAFFGTWLGGFFGLESTTAASGCGEAGPSIDPNGCPTATAPATNPASEADAGPSIDPNGH